MIKQCTKLTREKEIYMKKGERVEEKDRWRQEQG